jgi:transposase InsO family protein
MTTSNKDLISKTLAVRMMSCIDEYKRIKNKTSTRFKTVKELCLYNQFSHQNFMKVYHRFLANPVESMLVPQKRGPKYKTRRTDLSIEEKVLAYRKLGTNRYEIAQLLQLEKIEISPTTVYNIFKRHGVNKLNEAQKEGKRQIIRIIMEKIGELVHIDCHQLSKGITIADSGKTFYLLGMIDGYSRIVWIEVLENKKALNIMFAVLKSFNMLRMQYGIEIEAVLTDNGAEFGSGENTKNKEDHPFERLLLEMKIKHRYTKPYRPQTNGKIERFWKTLNEDFLEGSLFNDLDDLKNELISYLIYYNEHRPHSSLNGSTPKEFLETKQKCN